MSGKKNDTSLTLTAVCFINVTDKHNDSADCEMQPAVVSQGRGGCDVQLWMVAIFLSPAHTLTCF